MHPGMATIAFLGAGAMGQAMVPNLLRGGHSVRVYNRTIDKARLLERKGATACTTIAEAVRGVATGRGLRFLDCPVAGRPDAAAAAQLVVFVGGRAGDLADLRPMLEPLSRRIVHFGAVGTGNAFKLIYNVLGAVQVAALAESMNACEAAGIDLGAAADAFSDGNTGSPHVKRHSRSMATGKHDDPIGFTPHGRLKDTLYGCQYQEQVGGQALLGRAAAALFQQMIDIGWGERNDSEAIDGLRAETQRRKAKG
jgi:3-hydroxyisobutyrate dehydrogenase